MKKLLIFVLLLNVAPVLVKAEEGLTLKLESGAVWQHRNDVKIFPDSGTYLEFDKFNQGPFLHHRVEASYFISQKHGLRLVYAPFKVSVSGSLNSDLNYKGQVFPANQALTVNYQFNSYRLGYVYQMLAGPSYSLFFGFTGKIRDAKISIEQSSQQEDYDNFGFVPLLYFAVSKKLNENWQIFSDMDFAAAPQGRAIDFNFKLRRSIAKDSMLGVGYRTLEGGAENDKVFTFSWFNYAIIDLVVHF